MKKNGDSKKFQELVRHRMTETGEKYAIARAQLIKKRIEVKTVGHVLVGNGRLVPHREIRVRPEADRHQFFKALFGPDWRPPTERCPKCHEWITYDGLCACNAYERSPETTHVVTVTPTGAPPDDAEANPKAAKVRRALEAWMNLPEVPLSEDGTCLLAAKVGCLIVPVDAAEESGLYSPEPFGPEHIVLGDVTLEVDGGWCRYRLPPELGWWAFEQVDDANDGRNRFPAFLTLTETDDGYEIGLKSLRA